MFFKRFFAIIQIKNKIVIHTYLINIQSVILFYKHEVNSCFIVKKKIYLNKFAVQKFVMRKYVYCEGSRLKIS